ncbi:MAG: hypothetical protein HN742_24880 [Lentisphaerae bacterium]|jgi:hypothetical protein|nr:hypothetical protein [Lentisphaerota bacterium]MBT4822642.1 hypothetical protein [Lentisphaerota bacterium]MBT5608742.1 hypothetical protein [Lentisphaerota bacterium]MBT7054097.1 hypothetical protein [Lentisphaerota bacterium]MBT7845136.1 hypothetical protein [Lentisphaerota bacterium]
MLRLLSELLTITDTLGEVDIPYALCGGMALAAHGHPRFTRDIDLLVEESAVDHVKHLAGELGYTLTAQPMTFGVQAGVPRTVHRVSKILDGGELLTLDLLVVSPELEEAWRSKAAYEIDGHTVYVVSRGGLVSMKRLAGRDQDGVDIRTLLGDGTGELDD